MKVAFCFVLAFWSYGASGKLVRGRRATSEKTQVKGVYGLQEDCFQLKEDKKRFNICLDLNTLDPAAQIETVGGTRACYPKDVYLVNAFGGPNPKRSTDCLPRAPFRPGTVGAVYKPEWMDAAIEAQNVFEDLIDKDTVSSFIVEKVFENATATKPIPTLPVSRLRIVFPNGTAIPFTTLNNSNFQVDDIFITITGDNPNGTVASNIIATSLTQLNSAFQNATTTFSILCTVRLYPAANPFINSNSMLPLFLHEFSHCLGLSESDLSLNSFSQNIGEYYDTCQKKNFTIWTGESALNQWRDMGCDGPVPLEISDGLHLDSGCFAQSSLFTPFYANVSEVDQVTAGMLEDIGYSINFRKAADIDLDNLGGVKCGSFCPKVSGCGTPLKETKQPKSRATKRPKRRLYQDGEIAKKGAPKNGARKLNPEANIPTFSPPTDPEIDSFMRFVSEVRKEYPGVSDDATIHAVMVGANGDYYDMTASFGEADQYVLDNSDPDVSV